MAPRRELITGFGWNSLGIALHQNLALIQISDITGVGGRSFLLVMVNMMIVITIATPESGARPP